MIKHVVASTVGLAALVTGGAAVAQLPGAASDGARTHASTSVTGPSSQSAGHADAHGRSTDANTRADSDEATASDDSDEAETPKAGPKGHAKAKTEHANHGKGAQVSALARSTTLTGADKGAAISALASGGKSRAGRQDTPQTKPDADEHAGDHPSSHASGPVTGGSSADAPAGPPAATPDQSEDKRPVTVPNKGAAAGSHRH